MTALRIVPLLLLLCLAGCNAPSKASYRGAHIDGTPPFSSYHADGESVTTHSPEGLPAVHGVIDAEGAELINGSQPIAQTGIVLPLDDGTYGSLFIQSPRDVTGKGWRITMGSTTVEMEELSLLASAPLTALNPRVEALETRIVELSDDAREQWVRAVEAIESVAPDMAAALIDALGLP